MIRVDQFDLGSLVAVLLQFEWQRNCEIVKGYMPPHPRPETQPSTVIRWKDNTGEYSYLRHSRGPLQGFFWDVYGADFLTPSLALLALSQAPPPPRVGIVIPTHGRALEVAS